jgi:hypothetical protein
VDRRTCRRPRGERRHFARTRRRRAHPTTRAATARAPAECRSPRRRHPSRPRHLPQARASEIARYTPSNNKAT